MPLSKSIKEGGDYEPRTNITFGYFISRVNLAAAINCVSDRGDWGESLAQLNALKERKMEKELAKILLNVIRELAKLNLINQMAWEDDVEKLEEFIAS